MEEKKEILEAQLKENSENLTVEKIEDDSNNSMLSEHNIMQSVNYVLVNECDTSDSMNNTVPECITSHLEIKEETSTKDSSLIGNSKKDYNEDDALNISQCFYSQQANNIQKFADCNNEILQKSILNLKEGNVINLEDTNTTKDSECYHKDLSLLDLKKNEESLIQNNGDEANNNCEKELEVLVPVNDSIKENSERENEKTAYCLPGKNNLDNNVFEKTEVKIISENESLLSGLKSFDQNSDQKKENNSILENFDLKNLSSVEGKEENIEVPEKNELKKINNEENHSELSVGCNLKIDNSCDALSSKKINNEKNQSESKDRHDLKIDNSCDTFNSKKINNEENQSESKDGHDLKIDKCGDTLSSTHDLSFPENSDANNVKEISTIINTKNYLNEEILDQKALEKLSFITDTNEQKSSQNNCNTSSADIESKKDSVCENNISGAEVNLELFNSSEIEMVDLNENDFSNDKENNRISNALNEINSENSKMTEEVVKDGLEANLKEAGDSNETLKVAEKILPFQEVLESNFPENLEEETILGDTGGNAEKDKEEDICIVPDDLHSKLSSSAHNPLNKNIFKKNDSVNAEKSNVKVTSDIYSDDLEKLKPKNIKEDKILKSGCLRNSVKLTGNKLKTLVSNESPVDETGSNENCIIGSVHSNSEESHRMCAQCKEVKVWKFLMVHRDINQYLCSEQCSEAFTKNCQNEIDLSNMDISLNEYVRKCAQCLTKVTLDEKCLIWETMDFCNEDCLRKYQTKFGSNCANCKGSVFSNSLGKYCVRFGCDVKQFCSGSCLEEYKKGLKVCSYCQKDISTGIEGFLAPVGDKGQFKDFCTQSCMEKYEHMSSNTLAPDVTEECAVCSNYKPVRVEVDLDQKTHKLCSEPCFAAFKFVNNITEGQCDMCKKYFDRTKVKNLSIFYDEALRLFCCKTCMNVYILAHRKIIPCNWCKVKKYNFDMIKKSNSSGQVIMMCSLNCLTLHQLSINTIHSKHVKCDYCLTLAPPQYHLTMSDSTTRNFCSYTCVLSFQNQYSKRNVDLVSGNEDQSVPIPTGLPKKITSKWCQESSCVPVISSVQSLASSGRSSPVQFPIPKTDIVTQNGSAPLSLPLPTSVTSSPQIYQQIITKPPPAKKMKNKSILCKPYSHTKGVSCRPHPCLKETQTDQSLNRKFLIPIPVPIYVPCPMHMFATPFPVPVPFPLPVPVPIFIPTTRNSAKGIMKEIKKIQEKIPTDPFEAELLMMAEMVAGEKKQEPTDSESEDGNDGEDGGDGTFSPDNVDSSNTFGDDMLQMALKMASELEEPAVDMESVLASNTITTQNQPSVDPNKALYNQVNVMSINRGRKRPVRGNRNGTGGTPSKRGKRTNSSVDLPLLPPETAPPSRIEVEKPDADMCLKYTFGVNAWRHWVMQKNAELEKAAMTNRKIKLFKPELLQLTADELNFSLCLFVKEVRKPNGTEYAPDTIYYLCLGIQQYLFENGRIDNIFTDSYYEKFTDCLDEVARKFASLFNDSQYIVTRVEEEHLWESKQLGAHSPHVLLSTLMFFNTKHFNLVTVEEHMQLSFSHIMKHWKRNPNTSGASKVPGSRNVLLRFYPPQSALEANSRKKKVYEQQENEENPLRCPVKLYEFYLSKCPESVKTRNDVFYLLPERSCVPDSPVWYSTMALGKDPLMKMLHRVKMVKEINIALLSC